MDEIQHQGAALELVVTAGSLEQWPPQRVGASARNSSKTLSGLAEAAGPSLGSAFQHISCHVISFANNCCKLKSK